MVFVVQVKSTMPVVHAVAMALNALLAADQLHAAPIRIALRYLVVIIDAAALQRLISAVSAAVAATQDFAALNAVRGIQVVT